MTEEAIETMNAELMNHAELDSSDEDEIDIFKSQEIFLPREKISKWKAQQELEQNSPLKEWWELQAEFDPETYNIAQFHQLKCKVQKTYLKQLRTLLEHQ